MTWEEYKKQLPPLYSKKDLTVVERAFEYASEIHKDQERLNGEPFINHPAAVSLKIADLKLSPETVTAALLHDVAEESNASSALKTIRKDFGPDVTFLVKGLTKVDRIHYQGTERNAESLRRMFLAMAQDIRVVIIKLFDRLDNLETLHIFSPDKQKRIGLETLEIFAPLADRLGMGEVKLKLEDGAFKYVYPEEYEWLVKETKEKIHEREAYLKKIIPIVEKEIENEGMKINSIHYRAKHYYSLWKKLLRYNMDWHLIHDLMAVRIVVDSVEECYTILGIIHKLWKPLPGRIKDYIALPKQNGYQSLHTTVFCVDKKVTEFQIRTQEMHNEAEYGIAAHWAWEIAGKPRQLKDMPHKKFSWIKQLQEWQKKFSKSIIGEEFLDALKIDFFKDRVFVLTPKGDVIDLPEGATPVDFAYHIHSEVGNSMVAAKVNNRIVPLSHELISGDIVEIITQKNKKPNLKWLEFAKTPIAKQHIRNAMKEYGLLAAGEGKTAKQRKVEMTITAEDRIGMLKDISAVFSAFRVNLQNINTKDKDSRGIRYTAIYVSFTPKNKEQVPKIIMQLKRIKGVEEISAK